MQNVILCRRKLNYFMKLSYRSETSIKSEEMRCLLIFILQRYFTIREYQRNKGINAFIKFIMKHSDIQQTCQYRD
jgi:hypothetical protein